MASATPAKSWRFPVIVTVVYLLVGGAWVVGSDRLAEAVASSPEALGFLQTYKGLWFVGVTGLLLFLILWYEARRRAEREALIRRQALLLDKAEVAVFVREWKGRVIYWNKGAERIYGWSAEEMVGKDFRELVYGPDADGQRAKVEAGLLEHGFWRGELYQGTKSGDTVIVEANVTLVRDSKRRADAVLCINTDVTERRFLERQLRQAQKLESVGALTAGISHDFNNVLGVVRGYADLLYDSLGSEETDRRHMIEGIIASEGKGRNLVRRLTTFLKHKEGAKAPVSLPAQVREIVPMLRDTFPSRITIETDFEEDLPVVRGDPFQLQQMVLNLCTNAHDAIVDTGTIAIRVRRTREGEVATPGATEYLCLEVSDTGEGIPDEIRNNLFEPFVTTKGEGRGTGIGLWVVEGVVREHGGWIDLESERGRGTTFRIYLPEAEPGIAEAENRALEARRAEPVQKPAIVVEAANGEEGFAAPYLREYGFPVISMRSTDEALSLFQADPAKYAAVVVDFDHPGINGLRFVDRLGSAAVDTPLVVIAGDLDPEKEEELFRLGVADILTKPFGPMELARVMEEILACSRQPGPK